MQDSSPHLYEIPIPFGCLTAYFFTNEAVYRELPQKTMTHDHPDFELHYIREGRMRLSREDQEQIVGAGDVVLIHPQTYHFQEPWDPSHPPKLYSVRLSIPTPPENAPANTKRSYTALSELLSSFTVLHDTERILLPYFHTLSEELVQKQRGYYLNLQNAAGSILINIIRIAGYHDKDIFPDEKLKHVSNWRAQTEDFFYCRYKENLHLEDLAKLVQLSPRQTSRLLLQEYNMNFVSKLNSIRIHIAAEAILRNEKSLQEICTECGFTNYGYFSTCFRKKMGISPSDYRKKSTQRSK